MIYLAGRIQDKTELRATIATVVLLSAAPRIGLFAWSGLLTQPALPAAWTVLLPVAALGFWLGNHLHRALPGDSVLRVVYGLLALSGLSLLVRMAGS